MTGGERRVMPLTKAYRSPTLLKSAQDQPCMACGRRDGTTVAAHANRVSLGKGTGIKVPDYYVAFLCGLCHAIYDGRSGHLTKEEKDEFWTAAYLRTVAYWFTEGIVTVC